MYITVYQCCTIQIYLRTEEIKNIYSDNQIFCYFTDFIEKRPQNYNQGNQNVPLNCHTEDKT